MKIYIYWQRQSSFIKYIKRDFLTSYASFGNSLSGHFSTVIYIDLFSCIDDASCDPAQDMKT